MKYFKLDKSMLNPGEKPDPIGVPHIVRVPREAGIIVGGLTPEFTKELSALIRRVIREEREENFWNI